MSFPAAFVSRCCAGRVIARAEHFRLKKRQQALTDLSDYLAPSQICIKPVEESSTIGEVQQGQAATEIRIDQAGFYYEQAQASTSSPKKLEKAQITLNDCLACSGCITSAESVLVNMQSHEEFSRYLETHPDSVPVLSIAPQSLASLSVRHCMSPGEVLDSLRAFFRTRFGFRMVFDTTFARHLCLQEAIAEWRERTEVCAPAQRRQTAYGELPMVPLLASACPGWICYAEKTHGELLPLISTVKSPQQMAGTLVKEWWAPKCAVNREQIYHVSVMPCFDKKLEASRIDFQDDRGIRDVDCVLTTGEVQHMLDTQGWDLAVGPKISSDDALLSSLPLLRHPGSSSGSYLHNIIAFLMDENPALLLEIRSVRSDYVDYTLRLGTGGSMCFKGAVCYGFRNLQNIVRKLDRKAGLSHPRNVPSKGATSPFRSRGVRRSNIANSGATAEIIDGDANKPYDYIEVMACPSGCVNGGGQLAPSDETDQISEGMPPAKRWLGRVEDTYWSANSGDLDGQADELARRVIEDMGKRSHLLLRTQYRQVQSTEANGLAVKW